MTHFITNPLNIAVISSHIMASNPQEKAKELKSLIADFLLIASPTADVEFFSRFLNSDSMARVAYDGQRLAANGYTKFYIILHALQNISEIQSRSGPLYTFLSLSASRHHLYKLTNPQKLHQNLLNALLWTLRDTFIDQWTDDYEGLVEWGWNIIMEIYQDRGNKFNEDSISHRLTVARMDSQTFLVSGEHQKVVNAVLNCGSRQQNKTYLAQFRPTRASSLENLAIFESQTSLSFNSKPLAASYERPAPSPASSKSRSNSKSSSRSRSKSKSKKQQSESMSIRHVNRQDTHTMEGKGCMDVFYRVDIPISAFILVTTLRVFVRLTQFFDQLSDILLAINILSTLSISNRDYGVLDLADKILIYMVMILPLFPYVSLVPLLYRAVFHRLHRSGNTWFQHHPYLCRLIYIVAAIPVFVTLDLYVYSVKLLSNLSETKYLYPYWGARSTIEIILESIPQSILLLILFIRSKTNENAVIESIPLGLMIFGFASSFFNILVRLGELRYAATTHHKSLWSYLSEHLFQFRVLPWSDGLQLNQITSLHISNDLSLPEWIEFLQYLRINTSLQCIRCDGYLGIAMSLSLLRTLRNNRLTVIDLGNAELFSNIPLQLCERDTQKYLRAILPTSRSSVTQKQAQRDALSLEMTGACSKLDSPSERKESEANESDEKKVTEDLHYQGERQTISSILNLGDEESEEFSQFDITSDEVAIELQRIIDRNDNLRRLDLGNNRIGRRSHLLFGSIVNANSLRSLDLSENELSTDICGSALGIHLANIVVHCVKLHTFNLKGNRLMDQEVFLILNGLQSRKSRIALEVDVRNNVLTLESLEVLETCFASTNYLKSFKFAPQNEDLEMKPIPETT